MPERFFPFHLSDDTMRITSFSFYLAVFFKFFSVPFVTSQNLRKGDDLMIVAVFFSTFV